MKLLFDQNLSRRLVTILATEFLGSAHVGSFDLDTATDREIWDAWTSTIADLLRTHDIRPFA